MKFKIRTPSISKRISARTSYKRFLRHNIGIKLPRGFGFLSDPEKAIYNKIYNKFSMSFEEIFVIIVLFIIIVLSILMY